MPRLLPAAALAATAALAFAGAAGASTVTLALDPSNTGPYNQIDDSTYFIPRSSHSMLTATVLDDAGAPGNTCFTPLRRTLSAPAFDVEGGVNCPSDDGDGGRWGWDVHPTEAEQFRIATRPDDRSGPAESNIITLLTAPEMWWETGYRGNTPILSAMVQGDADAYAGTIQVRAGGRVVGSRRVTGTSGRFDVRIVRPGRRCRGCVARNARVTLMLVPDDRARWVTMTANGRATRGRQGHAGPVL